MSGSGEAFVWSMSIAFTITLTIALTSINMDMPIEKATLAQEVCLKANSKAVSFDRIEVTCENNAVIPLKGG